MAAKQEETTLMQQELLAVTSQIADDIRMCGYSSAGGTGFGFAHRPNANNPDYSRITDANRIYCTLDGNHNGTLDESGSNSSLDHVGYGLNINGAGNPSLEPEHRNVVKKYDTGAIHWQPIATNISSLKFDYYDATGNPIITPSANLNKIRSVQISVTAVPSPERAGLGIGSRTIVTRVWCRNLGI
ncbi:MAG: hypothetical protein EOL87_17415 [Spartobacteria bacterium]|nr:hypothetical protein [Spartobacteria bacterium]